MLKKKTIYIDGMHCQSCKTIIETEVDILPGVKDINVDHQTGKAEIEYDEAKINLDKIGKALKKINYSVKKEPVEESSKSNYLAIISIFLLFIAIYIILSQFGALEILARLNEPSVSLGLIFVIGILASFHCVGMCGGLIVSYSVSKKVKNLKPHYLYNLGRLISYTTIGAILGGIGSFFGLNPNMSGLLLLVASAFMVLMGLSLLTEHKFLKKIKINTPDSVARLLFNNKKSKNPKGPFLIGLLTGFMPCGPLQAMQLYALSTGSFVSGGLAMFVYSLATVPMLLGLGIFINKVKNVNISKLIKISGLIVIVLGVVMLNRGLANFGLGAKVLFADQAPSIEKSTTEDFQVVKMNVTYRGYQPNVLYLKKDVPVRWIIDGSGVTGCTDEIQVPEYNIKQPLGKGETVIEFTPTRVGEIKFHCWMKMVWGKFIVTDGNTNINSIPKADASTNDLPQSSCNGSCGSPTCGAAKSSGGCGCGK